MEHKMLRKRNRWDV